MEEVKVKVVKVKDNLVGRVFGRLTVLKQVEDHIQPSGQHQAQWLCECNCSERNKIKVIGSNLKRGNTNSCGCIYKETRQVINKTHGDSQRERLYTIWANMKSRCFNKNNKDYEVYGGRGITICEEWKEDYVAFKEWALSNGYNNNLTIDRINVDKNYSPSNCRWVDMVTQENNRTNNHMLDFNGEYHTVQEWSRITGINASTLYTRLSRGWSVEKTLTTK